MRAVDLPPFPSSAMDGFAVRAAETPGELPVAFRVAAGGRRRPARSRRARRQGSRREGRCRTAPTQSCPSSVVEDHGDHVDVSRCKRLAGQHVRPRGGDVRAGDVVVGSGYATWRRADRSAGGGRCRRRSSARHGRASQSSRREASCGPPGRALEAGQIYESNRSDDRGRAARAQGRDRRPARRRGRRRVASRRNRPRARARRARHVGRRLDGASTTSYGASRPSSASTRSSGASRSSPGSRSPSAFAATRSSSGFPGTRSRRSSARSSSSGPHFSRGRAPPSRSRATSSARHVDALRRNPHRDEFVRATRVDDGGRSSARADRRARSRT